MALHSAKQAQANGFIESFTGRFRDKLLNEVLFSTLADARSQIVFWTEDYKRNYLLSALGNIPPAEFAMKITLERQAAQDQKLTEGLPRSSEVRRVSGQ